jgi:hypothetical protein
MALRHLSMGEPMTDLQILALAGFIFVGLPAIIFCVALLIDRFSPGDCLGEPGAIPGAQAKPRKHRAF